MLHLKYYITSTTNTCELGHVPVRNVVDRARLILHIQLCIQLCILMCRDSEMRGVNMATNLLIDQELLNKAQKMGQYSTKRETVNAALEEYIHHREQKKIIQLFNTIEYEKDYDYKQGRKKAR